jgi:DNA-binding PadR family transcriptional regulator
MRGDVLDTHSDPSSLLPLTPAVFHIPLALAMREQHGYGIMQDVLALTHGQIRLNPGTLYRSIKQVLQWGLIEAVDERPDPSIDDERRRYYRLSDFGRRVGKSEAQRLAELVGHARIAHLLGVEGAQPRIAGGH